MVCSGGGENVRSVEMLTGAQLVDPRRLHVRAASASRALLALLTAVLLAPQTAAYGTRSSARGARCTRRSTSSRCEQAPVPNRAIHEPLNH